MNEEELENQKLPEEILKATASKYEAIREFTKGEEQFNNVIQEIALFEIVLGQINEIYKDTLYAEEVSTLNEAADSTVEIMIDKFAEEFISKTIADQALSSLPDLAQIVSWIEEVHINIAGQLFTEDYVKEVLAPSYRSIAEAIIEVSRDDIEAGEEETDAHSEG